MRRKTQCVRREKQCEPRPTIFFSIFLLLWGLCDRRSAVAKADDKGKKIDKRTHLDRDSCAGVSQNVLPWVRPAHEFGGCGSVCFFGREEEGTRTPPPKRACSKKRKSAPTGARRDRGHRVALSAPRVVAGAPFVRKKNPLGQAKNYKGS
nr:hypothetical protein [Pandoravirus massiliensis]